MSPGHEYSLILSLTNKMSHTTINLGSVSGISSGNATAIVCVSMDDDVSFSLEENTTISFGRSSERGPRKQHGNVWSSLFGARQRQTAGNTNSQHITLSTTETCTMAIIRSTIKADGRMLKPSLLILHCKEHNNNSEEKKMEALMKTVGLGLNVVQLRKVA